MRVQEQSIKWLSFEEAAEIAEKGTSKKFFIDVYTDWCGWCIRLQKEVLKTDDFAKWAKDNVILVELDFPRRTPQDEAVKKQNYELQNMFQVRGYPTIWLVNPEKKDGKTNLVGLGSTGYVAGGPSKWLAEANKILKK